MGDGMSDYDYPVLAATHNNTANHIAGELLYYSDSEIDAIAARGKTLAAEIDAINVRYCFWLGAGD